MPVFSILIASRLEGPEPGKLFLENAVASIRAQNLAPGVPVVMITTESSEEHVKQAILAGAQGYIRKPFTAEQVKERVLPLLEAA